MDVAGWLALGLVGWFLLGLPLAWVVGRRLRKRQPPDRYP